MRACYLTPLFNLRAGCAVRVLPSGGTGKQGKPNQTKAGLPQTVAQFVRLFVKTIVSLPADKPPPNLCTARSLHQRHARYSYSLFFSTVSPHRTLLEAQNIRQITAV